MAHQLPEFQLRNGPSKYDLMMALFEEKPVTFTLQRTGEVNAEVVTGKITGIAREDASKESWMLVGFIVDRPPVNEDMSFKAWYETRTRHGWLSRTV